MEEPGRVSELPGQILHLVAGAGVGQRGFDRRTVRIPVGEERGYDSDEWAGALVVVMRGRVELVGRCGGTVRLQRGDVTWLADLPLVLLRNTGDEPVELTSVRRGPAPS